MAYGMYGYGGLVCPIMDARRNQVYTGIYDNREGFTAVREQCAMDIDELVDELNNMETRVVFLGDGVPVYRERIAERMTVPFSFAPAHVNRQRPRLWRLWAVSITKKGESRRPKNTRRIT